MFSSHQIRDVIQTSVFHSDIPVITRIDIVLCVAIIWYMQKNISETHYRASRFCRVLGNPTAYEILKILAKSERTPTDLATDVGLSVKAVSETLRNLRQINLVRYTTKENRRVYFLKNRLLVKVLKYIEKYVERMRVQKW